MIYKNFRINIVIRVLLIVVLALLLAFVTLRQPMFFASVTLALMLLVTVISLVRYIEKSNKDLTHFLLSVRQGAFTGSYTSGNRGKQHQELSDAMNEMVQEFARLNLEKELHYQYLLALNEHIDVAILSFDTEGNLLMLNPTAKRLLNRPSFSCIEHFKQVDVRLYEAVKQIRPDERIVVKAFIGEDQLRLGVQLKKIVLRDKHVQIILLQNLNSELEAQEMEAWYQLIRVLTHEIMNSVTPIVSLTHAVQSILNDADGKRKDLTTLTDENSEDVFSSLTTIISRSEGLLKFVKAYKAYATPPEIKLESTDITALVTRMVNLLTADLQQLQIAMKINHPHAPVFAQADPALLEQVVINLIKNAMEAVAHDGSGKIAVDVGTRSHNRVSIAVSDNGTGIDPETMPRIFIPFFTTKAKGSGIGLSLSRQIMRLHGGTIRVSSAEGKGSVFTIEWR
jgi:two-component system, NtrC family, nitrogen regulation sensor histidine kinase NtrY